MAHWFIVALALRVTKTPAADCATGRLGSMRLFLGARCALVSALLLVLLGGCADTRYYWQAVHGHLQLMQAARPVDDWLQEASTAPALAERLRLAQAMRRFAVTDLHLPDNASYQRFVRLAQSHVVWNVVAAPAFSLTLKTWCVPVAGCVGYRGFFEQAQAQQLAAQLRNEGWEVSVYGVPAYSTLGWLNWLGGDPLLSSFVAYPEGQLAGLMFHELAHQRLYVADDTPFNESFASTVERLGTRQWLDARASASARAQHQAHEQRRAAFRALTRRTRTKLHEIYAQNSLLDHDMQALEAMKNAVMQAFRNDYVALASQWGAQPGLDAWVAQANNAAFGAQAAYDDLVPGFEALFERVGRDWNRFYDAVARLAQLPPPERRTQLEQLARESPHG